jgi:hypothetical protein
MDPQGYWQQQERSGDQAMHLWARLTKILTLITQMEEKAALVQHFYIPDTMWYPQYFSLFSNTQKKNPLKK